MKPICKMTDAELCDLINTSDDDWLIETAYEEREHRERAAELRDTREEDAAAAWNDRYQAYLNEY